MDFGSYHSQLCHEKEAKFAEKSFKIVEKGETKNDLKLKVVEKEIANMNVPADFDLSAHTSKLDNVISKLKEIASEDDIAKTYAQSLIDE